MLQAIKHPQAHADLSWCSQSHGDSVPCFWTCDVSLLTKLWVKGPGRPSITSSSSLCSLWKIRFNIVLRQRLTELDILGKAKTVAGKKEEFAHMPSLELTMVCISIYLRMHAYICLHWKEIWSIFIKSHFGPTLFLANLLSALQLTCCAVTQAHLPSKLHVSALAFEGFAFLVYTVFEGEVLRTYDNFPHHVFTVLWTDAEFRSLYASLHA